VTVPVVLRGSSVWLDNNKENTGKKTVPDVMPVVGWTLRGEILSPNLQVRFYNLDSANLNSSIE